MLHIILVILKIIGIIVACILGLLLFVLLSVMFVPARYHGWIEKKEKIKGMIHFHWFWHIVSAKVLYEEGQTDMKVRVFGILLNLEGREAKPKKKRKRQKPKKETAEKNKEELPQKPPQLEEKKEAEEYHSSSNTTVMVPTPVSSDDSCDSGKSREHRTSPFQRLVRVIRRFFQKFAETFRKIKYTIRTFCDRIKKVKENIGHYREIWKDEKTQLAFTAGKGEFFKLLRHMRPRKVKGWLRFGTGDPATTGELLGVMAVFYGWYRDRLTITPDFQEQVFLAELDIKGRVRAVVLFRSLWKLYRDENVKEVLKHFQ